MKNIYKFLGIVALIAFYTIMFHLHPPEKTFEEIVIICWQVIVICAGSISVLLIGKL